MRIGVPKEIKVHEYRVGLTPASVAELTAHGHELFIETNAGNGIDCPDKAFEKAGAKILPDAVVDAAVYLSANAPRSVGIPFASLVGEIQVSSNQLGNVEE